MKIGYFGGSFNPVHNGHLGIALAAKQAIGLDRLVCIPNHVSPFKTDQPPAESEARIDLLELALADYPDFEISDYECRREEVSYTVDTLEHFHQLHPEAELFFIIGADNLPSLHKWRAVDRLFELCSFIVVNRPGYASIAQCTAEELRLSEAQATALQRYHIEADFPISSSEVRRRIAAGESVDEFLPHAVLDFIKTQGLYASFPLSQPTEAVMTTKSTSQAETDKLLDRVTERLEDMIAENICVLDMREMSTVTKYYVLATGNSTPHLGALFADLEKHLKGEGDKVYRKSGTAASGWIVLDYINVVVHLMNEESREKYDIEGLWNDAPQRKIAT